MTDGEVKIGVADAMMILQARIEANDSLMALLVSFMVEARIMSEGALAAALDQMEKAMAERGEDLGAVYIEECVRSVAKYRAMMLDQSRLN